MNVHLQSEETERFQTTLPLERVSCNSCGSHESTVIARGLDFEYRTSSDEFHMVQCRVCSLVYLSPRPCIEALDRIYPPDYFPYRFDEILNPIVKTARNIVQKSKIKVLQRYADPMASIMDVGCGNGAFLHLLRQFGPSSWHLVGNDFSQQTMQRLEVQGFEVMPGRFETLVLPEESLDLITLNQVIEHLDDPQGVVRKAWAVLKPGGHLFIETPSMTGWDARLFSRRYWGGYHFPRHWTLYTPESLSWLVENQGFQVVEVTPLCSPSFWVQSFHHACSERALFRPLCRLFDFRNPLMMAIFTGIDLIQARFGMTSNMRLVCRKPG